MVNMIALMPVQLDRAGTRYRVIWRTLVNHASKFRAQDPALLYFSLQGFTSSKADMA